MKGSEVEKWRAAVGIEQQPTGPLFDRIQKIDSQLVENRKILKEQDFDGVNCRVIPEFTFEYPLRGGYNYGKAFFARPIELKEQEGPFDEREEPYVLAYIDSNKNKSGSDKYALRLDVLRGTVAPLSDTLDAELDPTIQSVLDAALEKATENMEKARKDYELKRRQKRRKAKIVSITGIILAGLAFGAKEVIDYRNNKHERQEAVRRAFDRSNYKIDGGSFPLSSGKVAVIAAEQFDHIPKYSDGDLLSSARRVQIGEHGCKTLHSKVPTQTTIHVGVRSGEPYANEPVGFSRDRNGYLVACSFSNFGDSQQSNEVGVAIQTGS